MKPQYSNENGMLINGNFWLVHPQTGETWDDASIADFIANYQAPDSGPSLDELKQQGVVQIKQEAAHQISALDWRLQRAEDRVSHAELTTSDNSTELQAAEAELLAVLESREAIRQASNDAEAELLALDDATAVEQFAWGDQAAV